MSERITKWDLVTESERRWMESQPFGHPCTGCGEVLATEADFARHFTVPNPTYKNLGYCPVIGKRGNW